MITSHKVYIEVQPIIKMALEGKYVNILGDSYELKDKPVDWVLHFCYKPNDVETFIKTGALMRICFNRHPLSEIVDAKEAYDNFKKSEHELDETESRLIFSGLEKMIKSGKKDLEIMLKY